jgi:hypothetical protein
MTRTYRPGKATVNWLVSRLVARPVVAHVRRKNSQQRDVGVFFLFPLGGCLLRGEGDQFTFRQLCKESLVET